MLKIHLSVPVDTEDDAKCETGCGTSSTVAWQVDDEDGADCEVGMAQNLSGS